MSILTDVLDFGAAQKARKAQTKEAKRISAIDAAEFDRRMGGIKESDQRLLDLYNRGRTDTSKLTDNSFATKLENDQSGFNEQTGIAAKAFNSQMDLLGGLMTSNRAARLQDAAAVEAEQARQRGFQDQADTAATALPGQIGYDAQQRGYADALGSRTALADANTTSVQAPSFAGASDRLRASMEGQVARGAGEARTDTVNAAKLSAHGDAFQGAERNLGTFADAIGQLTAKANVSRAALPYERGVAAVGKQQGQDDYTAGLNLVDQDAGAQSKIAANYHAGKGEADDSYSKALAGVLSDYYGAQNGAETNYINQFTDNSKDYTNKITGLGNYKIANTTASNPLSSILKSVDRAAAAYNTYKGG